MRRMGPETSETRSAIMDAVEAVLREKGYGALTVRNVANAAGLKHQLVYYYFHTIDELLLATYRRRTARFMARLQTAFSDECPLSAVWRTYTDPGDAALTVEYMALSKHNPLIGAETAKFGKQMGRAGLGRLVSDNDRVFNDYDPLALTTIIRAIASVLEMDSALGISAGHEETCSLVEQILGVLEAKKKPRAKKSRN